MKKREFSLKYGHGYLSVSLPEEQILCEIVADEYPPLTDVPSAVKLALEKPIDAPPLGELVKPGEKVVIVVSDITRSWQKMPLILPTVLNTLTAAGIPDRDISILVALGGHRPNTEEEFKLICGEEVFQRIKVVNHDACDLENMVYFGKTHRGTEVSINRLACEADRLILTGGIVYHPLAGYSGGRKSINPGIGSIKTLEQNHAKQYAWAIKGGGTGSAKTRGNAVHEDMMEIAGFVQPDFIVNMVPTAEGGVAGIFAGNWVSAWMEGTKLVDQIYGVKIKELADIVITTCGGFPKDINLFQTGKTLNNAQYAVKKGGVVILLSECPDIYEPLEFIQWFDYGSKIEIEKALRETFSNPANVALDHIECTERATFVMVTLAENTEVARKANMIPVTTLDEALEIAYTRCETSTPKITVMPQGGNTLPILSQE
jgi:nickel-dependent lactate racemase